MSLLGHSVKTGDSVKPISFGVFSKLTVGFGTGFHSCQTFSSWSSSISMSRIACELLMSLPLMPIYRLLCCDYRNTKQSKPKQSKFPQQPAVQTHCIPPHHCKPAVQTHCLPPPHCKPAVQTHCVRPHHCKPAVQTHCLPPHHCKPATHCIPPHHCKPAVQTHWFPPHHCNPAVQTHCISPHQKCVYSKHACNEVNRIQSQSSSQVCQLYKHTGHSCTEVFVVRLG
uniref:Uncharacterized protein n=1 Tax=Electrophorus electricus TaxID=8005 RepID=A0AAY5ELK6_ELEEL